MKETKAGFWLKMAACFLGGTIFAIGLLVNINTSAWFSSSAAANAQLGTATTDTIIEKLEIDEVDPKSIKIKKAKEFTSNPIIYFSVNGEAANYVLHINPIILDSHEEQEILIEPNLNLIQYLKLLFSFPDRVVEGKIRIKYLNEFIDEERQFKFTRGYLLSRFDVDIDRNKKQNSLNLISAENGIINLEEALNEEANQEIFELVKYVAAQRKWEEAQWFYETTVGLDEEDTLIKELLLTEEQKVLIDLIAPKLREMVASLINQLNEKIALIAEQVAEIKALNEANLQLQDEKTKLEEEKQKLEEENLKLQQRIEQLTKDIEALNLENYYLTQEVLNIRRGLFAAPVGGGSSQNEAGKEQTTDPSAGEESNNAGEESNKQEEADENTGPGEEEPGGSIGQTPGEEPDGGSDPAEGGEGSSSGKQTGEEPSQNSSPTTGEESDDAQ